MRKISTLLGMLFLLLVSMPSKAQLDELKGMAVSLSDPVSSITTGQWYVMHNGGRDAYAYSSGLSTTLYCSAASQTKLNGANAEDVAGYLVRFAAVDGVSDAYTIQTGYGDYWNTLTSGNNNGTVESEPAYFTGGLISGENVWFWFKGNNGEMQLDCNAAGGTVAGWTTEPTNASSNAAWELLPVEFVDVNSLISANITYNYYLGNNIEFTYTDSQRGIPPFEVAFDAPRAFVGATCSSETAANETISESKDITINYYYDLADNAPFVVTTITDNQFADDTKWYYLQCAGTTTYVMTSEDGEVTIASSDLPVYDTQAFYAFTGNPIAGYKIYSKIIGAGKSIDAAEVSYDSTPLYYSANSQSVFVLEEGNNDNQYRFRLSTEDYSYINGYEGYMYVYNYDEGWAAEDAGSQYYITEVSQEILDRVAAGVLKSYAVSPATGTIFRDGDGLETVLIGFEDDIATVSPNFVITLVDENDEVVATPAYAVDANEPNLLSITFDPTFTTEGNYRLIIPEGTVVGVNNNLPCVKHSIRYSILSPFEPKVVTGRIWKSYKVGTTTYTNWEDLLYEDGKDYYKVKVDVKDKDHVVILDWENIGNENNNLDMTFDLSKTSYNGLSINGNEVSATSSYFWTSTKNLVDDGYYGIYIYPGSSNYSLNEDGHGELQICTYCWESGAYPRICVDWYMDDRYSLDIVKGQVWNKPVDERVEGEVAWTQLNYNNDGYYDVEVAYNGDNTVIIYGYTGVEGEDKTIVFDPETGDVVSIDGDEGDEVYGAVWCWSSVLDGTSYDGYYEYVGSDSHVEINEETGKGVIWLVGDDYSEDENDPSYRYLFITFDLNSEADEDDDNDDDNEDFEPVTLRGYITSNPLDGYTGTAWTQLPYNENNCYEVMVRVTAANTFTIVSYTGVEGEDKTVTFDPSNNYVTDINGLEVDDYSCVWNVSSVLDGTSYNGYYEYVGSSSRAGYDAESKTGYAALCGVDYTNPDEYYGENRYLYLTFGPDEMEDGIASVKTATSTNSAIFDLGGRKLNSVPAKGIYIANGKKVLR